MTAHSELLEVDGEGPRKIILTHWPMSRKLQYYLFEVSDITQRFFFKKVMSPVCFFLALLMLVLVDNTSAFPNGAPLQACQDLLPRHPAPPQRQANPYKLVVTPVQKYGKNTACKNESVIYSSDYLKSGYDKCCCCVL